MGSIQDIGWFVEYDVWRYVCRSSCHLTTISVHAHVQIEALLYVTHLDATFRFSTNSVPSLRTIKICSTVSRSCDGVLLRNRDSPLDIAKESVFVFAECLALGIWYRLLCRLDNRCLSQSDWRHGTTQSVFSRFTVLPLVSTNKKNLIRINRYGSKVKYY